MIRTGLEFADTAIFRFLVAIGAFGAWIEDFSSDERGEGPVSAAIVVMIMAFLGVALWVAFKAIMHQATTTVSTQVSQLGQ